MMSEEAPYADPIMAGMWASIQADLGNVNRSLEAARARESTMLRLFASIDAHLSALHSDADRREHRWVQQASDISRVAPQRKAKRVESTEESLSLGGPQNGRVWSVQSITVGGITPSTTVAGTADVIQSPTNPTLTTVDLTSWRDHAATLPLIGFYTTREVELRYPDELWVVVNNGTIGQQYIAVAWVLDYQDGGYPASVGF